MIPINIPEKKHNSMTANTRFETYASSSGAFLLPKLDNVRNNTTHIIDGY